MAILLVVKRSIMQIEHCYGFGWGRVNFLCRGLFDAMFGNFGKKTVVIEQWCLVLAEQCCAEPRMFQLVLHCQWRGWGHQEPGGDGTRTAALSWPQRYSVPHGIVWKTVKLRGSWLGGVRTAGHAWLVMSNCLSITCFVNICMLLLFFLSSLLVNSLYLSPRVLPFFSDSLLIPLAGWWWVNCCVVLSGLKG